MIKEVQKEIWQAVLDGVRGSQIDSPEQIALSLTKAHELIYGWSPCRPSYLPEDNLTEEERREIRRRMLRDIRESLYKGE